MSLVSALRSIANDWAAARRAAETERFLGALPLEVRKDIGWPSETAQGFRASASAAARAAN